MKLKLKEIAAISGKPGLFKIVKPTRTGVIVESLDEKKTKLSVGAAHRVSILKEVSIYTNDQEGAIALEEVLHRIYENYKGAVPFDSSTEKQELVDFMEKILPDYDRDKVYVSDMKKLVSWYNVIHDYSPITLEYLLREDELDNIPDPDPEPEEDKSDEKTEKKINPKLRTKAKKPKSSKKSKRAQEKAKQEAKKAEQAKVAEEKQQEVIAETPKKAEKPVKEEVEKPVVEEQLMEETPTQKNKSKKENSLESTKENTNGKEVDVTDNQENSEEELADMMSFASELEQKFKVKRGSKKKRRRK